jgi:hypothetical protein
MYKLIKNGIFMSATNDTLYQLTALFFTHKIDDCLL